MPEFSGTWIRMPDIARLETVIDVDTFQKALELIAKKQWLVTKERKLIDLLSECKNRSELNLISDLILRFRYFEGINIEFCLRSIAHQINSVWNLGANNTVIVGKKIEEFSDSSLAVNYMIQPSFASYNGWSKGSFTKNLENSIFNAKYDNIVIVDDYSGSGLSLNKLCKWTEDKIRSQSRQINIYACFFCVSQQTISSQHPILKELYAVQTINRGISDHFGQNSIEIDTMKSIEARLKNLPARYEFGFEQTEALYGSQNFNIPNNNFPVFWWDKAASGTRRNAMFARIGR